jgi:hypothetical protein
MLKPIILPRQAGDKHRESREKEAFFFAGHDTTPLSLRPGEALTLHVYLDGFLVEVVANNRASLATSVPMPLNGDAVLPLGDMEVAAFDAWALKSIWA